jgi:L-rhamnose mutarotase
MIHVLHSLLVAGDEAAYETAHRRVPDELADALLRSGITGWSIHRVGNHVIHLIESDDLGASFAELEHDPANQRWQEVIGIHVDRFEPSDDSGSPLPIAPLWSLDQQVGANVDGPQSFRLPRR